MHSPRQKRTATPGAKRKTGADAKARPPQRRTRAVGRLPSADGARPSPSGTQPAYKELLRFFNESPDLLCIVGFDGKFKRLNPAWEPALGWTAEELQARPFLDFVHPDDRPLMLVEMDKLATATSSVSVENRYSCKDGSWRWLQWTAAALPDRREIYAIARDVTRSQTADWSRCRECIIARDLTQRKLLDQEILRILNLDRERMGRKLQDGLCQELAGIAALSATLARSLAPAAAREAAAAREIGKLLGQSIRHARDLAHGLVPLHLEMIGLVRALTTFCLNTEAIFKITCRLDCQDRPPKLDADRESHLFHIAQEAVNNAIAHGRARNVGVALAFQKCRGILMITDDGMGMGDKVDRHEGIGLHTMADRTRLIGASIEFSHLLPHGTAVTCVFPVPPPEPKLLRHARKKEAPERTPKKTHPPR